MKIGVLAAENSWHFQDLKRAASTSGLAVGGCDLFSVSFEELASHIPREAGPLRLMNRHFDMSVFDRLIVRTMPGGSLQQVVFRMDLLNRIEAAGKASGARIVNSPRAMEISVDKYLSLAMLSAVGIQVPETCVSQMLAEAIMDFQLLGGDVVYKPLFGSMGKGIVRLCDPDEAARFFETQIKAGQVIYQQKFIAHGDQDFRLLVVGEEVFGMRRVRAGHWLTNIAQGARGEPFEPNAQQKQLAITACRAVGCRIAGVDLLVDNQTGTELVVDVNAAPGWKAISEVTSVDIAECILAEVAQEAD